MPQPIPAILARQFYKAPPPSLSLSSKCRSLRYNFSCYSLFHPHLVQPFHPLPPTLNNFATPLLQLCLPNDLSHQLPQLVILLPLSKSPSSNRIQPAPLAQCLLQLLQSPLHLRQRLLRQGPKGFDLGNNCLVQVRLPRPIARILSCIEGDEKRGCLFSCKGGVAQDGKEVRVC